MLAHVVQYPRASIRRHVLNVSEVDEAERRIVEWRATPEAREEGAVCPIAEVGEYLLFQPSHRPGQLNAHGVQFVALCWYILYLAVSVVSPFCVGDGALLFEYLASRASCVSLA